jgi:uncharacterized repeat protein (TIGR01451 family)
VTSNSSVPWQAKVDPWVLQTASQGDTEFLVSLASQADLSQAKSLPTKSEKGWYVYRVLTELASRSQAPLVSVLATLGVQYHPYWVTNAIWVRAGLRTIQQLAERSDVAHIYANPMVTLDGPVQADASPSAPQAVEWNIQKVNADDVWALGDTGQGVVIGGADTGYAWDHPAIKNQYRGWQGASVDHNYNWFDATPAHSQTPVDPYGHGTHTMGIMVGDDGGNNQIGMAPGARWIGCRNMDAGGIGTPASYIACYQWFIAPTQVDGTGPNPDMAPDVINNSWGCTPGEGCTSPNILLGAVQNLVAAGIITVHSAGNSGSNCSTISEPAAIYDESFTVGATNASDGIVGFSSRGPVTVDGSNRPKPDLSAPGLDVRSCYPGGGYTSMSGTSMAGPHVAGLVALLISATPDLRGQVSQIESIIEQNARHIPATGCNSSGVPNNIYGWGRIDALAAVQALHHIELEKVASAVSVIPGDLITYTLTITYESGINPTTQVILTDTIPADTSFVSATGPYSQIGNDIRWNFASMTVMESRSVTMTVQADDTATGTITNDDYVVKSDQVIPVYGDPVYVGVGKLDILSLNKFASAPLVFPGDLITYSLVLTDSHAAIPATGVVLTDTLPVGSQFVRATGPYTRNSDVVRWDFPRLDPQGSLRVDLVVKVDWGLSGSLVNADYTAVSGQAFPVHGDAVTTPLGRIYFLPTVTRNP